MWRCLVLTILAAPAIAADGIDPVAQRERIAQERAQVEAQYQSEAARCAGQFSVTSCVERARARRRAAIERLDHERAVLDDMERKRRAAERLQRIEDKLRAADTRPPLVVHAVPRSAKAARAASAVAEADAAPASAASSRAAEAAYRQRQREAAAHREAVERRNAARAARRAPAAPLPTSPSAPAR